ncbi:MAG: hypothetical protein LBC03_07655, partial [Nitrososphaerota archaeon]|nr:hypothetical protein [Nitrososphaerota archaeon]
MAIEKFTVQLLIPNIVCVAVVSLIVIGIVMVITNLLLRNRLKAFPVYGLVGIGAGLHSKYFSAVFGILLIVIGGFLG